HREFAAAVALPPGLLDPLFEAWREEVDLEPASALQGAGRDRLLAHGERFAATLFAAGLRALEIPAAPVMAGDAGLVTDDRFGAAHPLPGALALLERGLAR